MQFRVRFPRCTPTGRNRQSSWPGRRFPWIFAQTVPSCLQFHRRLGRFQSEAGPDETDRWHAYHCQTKYPRIRCQSGTGDAVVGRRRFKLFSVAHRRRVTNSGGSYLHIGVHQVKMSPGARLSSSISCCWRIYYIFNRRRIHMHVQILDVAAQ